MPNGTVRSAVGRRLARFGAIRIARGLGVSAPVIGTFIALAAAGSAMRQKGVLGGAIDTALNAIPLVGLVKNGIELVRGDLIPDRPDSPPATARPVSPSDPVRSVGERVKSIRL